MDNFDDAKNASKHNFEDNQLTLDDAAEQQTDSVQNADEDVRADENAENTQQQDADADTDINSTLNNAVSTAEVAAQAAAEKDTQLKQALSEIEAMKEKNSQLEGAIEELSKKNKENVIENAMNPPVLDVGVLTFSDDETQRAMLEKYSSDMAEYNRKQIMDELAPVIEQANKAKYAEEKEEVMTALARVPELKGIDEMAPQLDNIIKNNKALSSDDIPIDEKYIMAYAIAKGVDTINHPVEEKKLSAEELLQLYNDNPEFQELVEKQRVKQVKQNQQVPTFSASSGAVNAALNIREKPKNFDDSLKRTLESFRN